MCEVRPDRADEKLSRPEQVDTQTTSDPGGGPVNCERQVGGHPRQGSGREGPGARAAHPRGSRHTPVSGPPGRAEGSARLTAPRRPPTPRRALSEASSGTWGHGPAAWPEAELGCPPGARDTERPPRTHSPAKVEPKGHTEEEQHCTAPATQARRRPREGDAAALGGGDGARRGRPLGRDPR